MTNGQLRANYITVILVTHIKCMILTNESYILSFFTKLAALWNELLGIV